MSYEPCPHCGTERCYGVPEKDLEAKPTPATCACGKEGPPNLPYDEVAQKIYEVSCDSFTVNNEFECPCGEPVAVGQSRNHVDLVITHRIPHCMAFRNLRCVEFLEWVHTPADALPN